MDGTQQQPSTVEGSNTIELYRQVIARVIDDRALSITALADKIRADRSLLGKFRKGTRSIQPALVNALIAELDLDRERLALAILVMGKPDYYFDPRFRNACYVIVELLNAAMSRPADESAAIALKTMSKENCQRVAIKAVDKLLTMFSTPEGIEELAAALFGRPN